MKELIKALKDLEQKVDELTLYHKEFFTPKEAARFIAVSPSTLYKWMSLKVISYHKPNNQKLARFIKADLVEWLTKNRIPSNTEIRKEVVNGN